jgi:alpha-beta hydrolase superfamily lysophospholipase
MRRLLISVLLSSGLCSAQTAPVYVSVPGIDAPELAGRGQYAVGVRTIDIVHPAQPDILHFDKSTGKAPLYDRPLKVEIWYPATIPPGKTEQTTYESAMPGRNVRADLPPSFTIAGKALRDAPAVGTGPFPLVIVSHGYPGSRTLLTYLTENLASKGYVVAAIDHTDSVYGAVKDFSSTLLNRTNDQLFTMDELGRRSRQKDNFLHGLMDPGRVAIVGYSMGGYGVLSSAGAAYSSNSMPAKFVPGKYLSPWLAGSAELQSLHRENLKAVVAIAPWGNQPPYNAWDAQGLAGIHIPSLFIDGDQDDVSDYQKGVKPAFERAVNSDRCMLVYENARHNVGPDPPPPDFPLDFAARASFAEPVWRQDRINAINDHFITAFLDLYLKGDASRRSYLHVKPEKSNDGQWPQVAGQPESAYAVDGQNYWKGFQRRWAVGLQMYCMDASK